MSMYLGDAPSILAWGTETKGAEPVHERYDELVAGALSALLGEVGRTDPARAARLADAARAAGTRATEVLVSPEVSYRLLWPRRHDPVESADFLLEALAPGPAPWEATRLGGLAVDFDSPYALYVDLEGTRARRERPEDPLAPTEQREVSDKIVTAMDGVAAAGLEVDWFVRRFTKAVVVLRDPAAPDKFSSGSTGQFIGRSALGNAQLAKVTPAKMAEALVHEAIHSYLYMGEQRERWLLDVGLYTDAPLVPSPWTGASLNLRPFLQACFVWYGLLRFWGLAAAGGMFPTEEVRERVIQAATGFVGAPLLDRVAAVADRLAPELRETIATMQEEVVTVFGEGAGVPPSLPAAG